MTTFETTLFGFAVKISFSSYTDPSVGIFSEEIDSLEILKIGEIAQDSPNFQNVLAELEAAAGSDDVLDHAMEQQCFKELERLEAEEASKFEEELRALENGTAMDHIGGDPEKV